MIYRILFLVLGNLVDLLVSIVFPNDFSLMHPVFLSQMGFIAFLFICRDEDFIGSIKYAVVYGLCLGFFFPSNIWSYVICFLVVLFFVKVWFSNLSESLPEMVLIAMLSIFVKFSVMYLCLHLSHAISMGYFLWTYKITLLTLAGNLPASVAAYYLHRISRHVETTSDEKKQKSEKNLWNEINER